MNAMIRIASANFFLSVIHFIHWHFKHVVEKLVESSFPLNFRFLIRFNHVGESTSERIRVNFYLLFF
jgi:hypothetical protein